MDFNRFDPGSHTLLVNVMSTGGEIATHEVVFMVPDPLGKQRINTEGRGILHLQQSPICANIQVEFVVLDFTYLAI